MLQLVKLLTVLPALGLALAEQVPLTHTLAQANADLDALLAADPQLESDTGVDWPTDEWSGLVTFGHAQPARCWGADKKLPFDIAVIGAPFDTGTSFRPGSRFGPNGIRQGSRRVWLETLNVPWKTIVTNGSNVVDCGDVPMVPSDNKVALRQLDVAAKNIFQRNASTPSHGTSIAQDGLFHPRVLTLGGDHTITLPLLRAAAAVYGPVSVVHFDSHIDTWGPQNSTSDEDVPINHATYFWHAAREGLLAPNQANIHVGIRGNLNNWAEYDTDAKVGFHISPAGDIDDEEAGGLKGIVKRIKDVVGNNPVYITLDIDVIDPGLAPATGTPEPGGFTSREMKRILLGLSSLKIVGADIVEVAPAYDTQDEITSIVAANLGWDILALMRQTPLIA